MQEHNSDVYDRLAKSMTIICCLKSGLKTEVEEAQTTSDSQRRTRSTPIPNENDPEATIANIFETRDASIKEAPMHIKKNSLESVTVGEPKSIGQL